MTPKKSKPSPRRIIERPRLMRLLSDSPARIKLLVAPAGYGKTTLARQWLEEEASAAAWCTCSQSSADIAVLIRQVGVAVAEVGASADLTLERLSASQDPASDLEPLLELLVEAANSWPDMTLFIDDYHELMSSAEAERVIEALVARSQLGLFIASRRRPSWATGRQILYGDVLQIGRAQLAMRRLEINEMLGHQRHKHAAQVAAETGGWPAFVGLAATTPTDVPDLESQDALYEYVATEIYAAASEVLRDFLRVLAFAPHSQGHVLRAISRGDQGRMLEAEAVKAGVLTGRPLEVHPLLREFLRRRTFEIGPAEIRRVFGKLWTYFTRERQWDEAFALIVETQMPQELPRLLDESMDEMLTSARTLSLERWAEYARAKKVEDPIVTLVDAETALRRGRTSEAESLASHAADLLRSTHRGARAWCVAGRAAHLQGSDERALRCFERALQMTEEAELIREATWGRFVAAVDLELETAAAALAAVREVEDGSSPRALVRRWNAQLLYELRMADLVSVDGARAAAAVVDRLPDPVARAGFWSSFTSALGISARYEEAATVATVFLADAERFRIDFAVPYAHQAMAVARIGLRRFDEAEASLAASEILGTRAGDIHVLANAKAIRSRLLLIEGRYREAQDVLLVPESVSLSKGMHAELRACLALALACTGDKRASEEAGHVLERSRSVESAGLAACAQAVLASVTGDPAMGEVVHRAVSRARRSGNIDAFICSYRAHPELLPVIAGDTELLPWLRATLEAAHDSSLSGTWLKASSGMDALSPRELEILSLVAQGLRNREIAQKFFLSEATVKLHVHRVLEKLGVRTRTAAARLFIAQRRR